MVEPSEIEEQQPAGAGLFGLSGLALEPEPEPESPPDSDLHDAGIVKMQPITEHEGADHD